ncbi:hypothetical protein [Psychroserpens algicola]|uniref:hypothetical protein n=1 Tax=Psychroserpens algicola TaxID=1719034 RepID=UPI001953AE1B|nr:hypothetical protein [Psychroserpens algicola]
MIDKEDKYRKELIELFKYDLEEISDDELTLKLIKEIFLADIENINAEEILDKLTSNE